jgi:hypothetical protein
MGPRRCPGGRRHSQWHFLSFSHSLRDRQRWADDQLNQPVRRPWGLERGIGGTGLPVKGMSCPTTSACAAVDNNADAIVSTSPTGGASAWSSVNVIPSPAPGEVTQSAQNGMFGISCPAITLCVGVGAAEQVIVSTDPFAVDLPPRPVRKSKVLRAVITRHPAKRVNPRRGGVAVRFGFHAIGGRAVRFECKLVGGQRRRHRSRHMKRLRFSACSAPSLYHLGKGKYFFRVRAVSAKGRVGPPAGFHFRVGRLVERKSQGSCPPSVEESSHPCVGTPDLRAG